MFIVQELAGLSITTGRTDWMGSELPVPSSDNNYNAFAPKMAPVVELRVISFRTEDSE